MIFSTPFSYQFIKLMKFKEILDQSNVGSRLMVITTKMMLT